MSQHPSLREDSVGAKHRNVLKRFERIKKLQEQNKWQDRPSAFGLPKVKSMKIKIKKVKEVKAEGEAAPGTAAAPAGATPAGSPAGKVGAPAAAKGAAGAQTPKAAPTAPKQEKVKK